MAFPKLNQLQSYSIVPNSSITPTSPVLNVVKPVVNQTSSSVIIENQVTAIWITQVG